MKKCPSCNAQCEESVELCPVCGYSFADGGVGDKQDRPKKTMMGFPSLSALPDEEEEPEQQDPVKQTLFGFPANEEEQEDPGVGEEESEEEDAYAATHIIPASEFSFADEDSEEDSDADLRGTIAGRPARESEEDDNTEIVPGTALFPGREVDQQLEQQAEQSAAEEPNRGTLLGMSLKEVEALSGESSDGPAAGSRSTQFAIPAAQRGEPGNAEDETQKQTITEGDLDSAPSEDEEEFDDAPTQAWDPGSLNLKEKFDPKGRKKLLEKIRKSRPSNRDTSKGIPGVKKPESNSGEDGDHPDLSALKKLRPKRELVPTPQEFPEDERETQEHEKAQKPSGTPASGVVRPPKRPSAPAHDTEENKSAPGGASAYMLGPGQTQRDGPKKGVPIGQLRSDNPQPAQPKGLGDGLSDPEFATAETDIASGDLLEQAGVAPDPTPVEEVSGFDETLAGGGLKVTDQSLANAADQSGGSSRPSGPPSQPGTPQSGQGQHQLRPRQDQQRPNPQPGQQQPAPQPGQQAQQQQAQQQQAQQQLRPGMASDRFTPSQRRTKQPNIYETFDGGPSSAPQGQAPVPSDPTHGMKQSSRPGEDPLVRTIQSLFGVIAGAITLIVQVVVLLDGFPESTLATVVVALALTMGLAAIVSSLAPISMQMRSLALFGIGALIGVTFILGFVVTIPSTFLVVALGAFVAVMAAAFPIIARHLL